MYGSRHVCVWECGDPHRPGKEGGSGGWQNRGQPGCTTWLWSPMVNGTPQKLTAETTGVRLQTLEHRVSRRQYSLNGCILFAHEILKHVWSCKGFVKWSHRYELLFRRTGSGACQKTLYEALKLKNIFSDEILEPRRGRSCGLKDYFLDHCLALIRTQGTEDTTIKYQFAILNQPHKVLNTSLMRTPW